MGRLGLDDDFVLTLVYPCALFETILLVCRAQLSIQRYLCRATCSRVVCRSVSRDWTVCQSSPRTWIFDAVTLFEIDIWVALDWRRCGFGLWVWSVFRNLGVVWDRILILILILGIMIPFFGWWRGTDDDLLMIKPSFLLRKWRESRRRRERERWVVGERSYSEREAVATFLKKLPTAQASNSKRRHVAVQITRFLFCFLEELWGNETVRIKSCSLLSVRQASPIVSRHCYINPSEAATRSHISFNLDETGFSAFTNR